jgi:hypothetical protein
VERIAVFGDKGATDRWRLKERTINWQMHFGLPIVVSSALESAVGINYGLKPCRIF